MALSLIGHLEQEWAKQKYVILEKDPAIYQKIRTLLKQKQDPDVKLFHALIDEALLLEAHAGRQDNALCHVWGYFKNITTSEEKAVFDQKHSAWLNHSGPLSDCKSVLFALSVKYDQVYLLNSTYFDDVR